MPEKKVAARATVKTTRATAAKARPPTPRARKAPPAKIAQTVPSAKAAVVAWKAARTRTLVGYVVADKTPKTVIVEVTRLRQHPLYKKVIRVRKHYPTHDPREEARLGDLVRIQEGRAYSATKRFRVAEILSRAGEAREAAPEVGAVEAALEELEGVAALRPAKKETAETPKAAAAES